MRHIGNGVLQLFLHIHLKSGMGGSIIPKAAISKCRNFVVKPRK